MMKKKRYKMSSDAMEAAEIKNRAEECRRNAMDKIELRHHRNNLHEAEIIRKEAVKHLEKIHDICPVTYEELKAHHQNQYKKRYKANIHIVNCYLARQEENKETWRRMRVTKEQRKSSFAREKVNTKERLELCKNYLEDIPVKADDHITFIAKAFPEFFMLEDPQMTLERDWSGDLLLTSNIYSGARAAHDRKCMSTRVQPISVGKYPRRKPLNFKNVKPGHDWPPELTSKEPSLLEAKDKLPPIGTPFTLTTSASPHVGGFSKLHKRNKKNKVRRVSMMSQTGTSAVRQLHFKLPKINL